MNPLSSLSIIICTCFCIGAGRFFFSERRDLLNKMAAAVLLSLGWWSFCNAFFYASPNAESAFFWHRFAAIGWCGFVSLTAYYFYVLTNPEHAPMAGCSGIVFYSRPSFNPKKSAWPHHLPGPFCYSFNVWPGMDLYQQSDILLALGLPGLCPDLF